MHPLLQRTLSSLVFVGVMAGGLLLHPLAYAVVMLCAIGIMVIEFYRLTIGRTHRAGQIIGFLACLSLFALTFLIRRHQLAPTYLLLELLPLFLLFCTLLGRRNPQAYPAGAYLFLPLLYIALPFSLPNLWVFTPIGSFEGGQLLWVFVVIWMADVGAYLTGMSVGRRHGHPLCPRLSPKKTWEGALGGLLFSLLTAYLLHRVGAWPFALGHAYALAALICSTGILGDLTESALKRHAGVKDSGGIMPGHGGLLDRFDGALFALPAVTLYFAFIFSLI